MEVDKANDFVRLRCIKEAGKLRVRIVSGGYNPFANCQFPRDIRQEGREYLVPSTNITFAQTNGHKFFYRVKKNNIQVLSDSHHDANDKSKPVIDISKLTIYQDETDVDCCVCMASEKDTAFYPCGHFHCCDPCAKTLKEKRMPCPICRTNIQQLIHKDQFQ